MQTHNLNALIECGGEKFSPKVLMEEPGYRMLLLCMRAGQLVREPASRGLVTIHSILGHITLFAGYFPEEVNAWQVICIASGASHRIERIEGPALLVFSTGGPAFAMTQSEKPDLCQVPNPERHPFVFKRFDALELGESFVLTTAHNRVPLERERDNPWPGVVRLGAPQPRSRQVPHPGQASCASPHLGQPGFQAARRVSA